MKFDLLSFDFQDERDINTDFLLVLLRDMLNAYPQLKVVLMSGKKQRSSSFETMKRFDSCSKQRSTSLYFDNIFPIVR